MIQPTDYEFATANTSDAEIVRRFLAKAYGEEHPAMAALKKLKQITSTCAPEPAERLAIVRPPKPDFREGTYDCAIKVWLDTDAIAGWLDKDGVLHIVDQGGRSLDDGERGATLHGDFGAMECNTVNPTTGGYHD